MAWLDTHRPVRDQWYAKRNRALTGACVLHTAESVMDSVGPDTGAENVAEFIRTRTTPGSYHDLVDSDTAIQLVDYNRGAYHDGTGSNNWALSISFACRTSDWARMKPEQRKAFLRQGAIAFARQQAYRKSVRAPLTELRLITKAQSDAGQSGFIYHGHRDPGRRSDPGVAKPNLFPFAEFLAECSAVLSGRPAPVPIPEDDMTPAERKMLSEVHAKVVGAVLPLTGRPGAQADDMYGHVLSGDAAARQALAKATTVEKKLDEVLALLKQQTT